MFTGLIEGIGKINEVSHIRGGMRLAVTPFFDMSDSRVGDSLCVNGICLTITGIQSDAYSMDVSGETISRTTMGKLRQGDAVNLERSLRLSGRLDGHLLSGHVDGTGKILKIEAIGESWLVRIGVDEILAKYIIEKGSIAVDGISLTINYCRQRYFEVNIIPQTNRETTILKKRVGDLVNIETDIIGKYVEKFLFQERLPQGKTMTSVIDRGMLKKYGFGN